MGTVTIDSRFCGPPGYANGGWTAGALAKFIQGPAQVTLRRPTPLDVALEIKETSAGLSLYHGETLLAEAEPKAPSPDLPDPVSYADAEEATRGYIGHEHHPYPTCFVCGTARGDEALRLFPGAVSGRDVAAAPWRVPEDLCENGRARTELVWAALDCPSWFGHQAFHPVSELILLARLTAQMEVQPAAGERCVVVGFSKGIDGRKIFCGSALFRESGECLACAEALWITVPKFD